VAARRVAPTLSEPVRRLLVDVVVLNGEQDAAPSLEDMAQRAWAILTHRNERRLARASGRGRGP
jgi:hypothetical protein